LIFSPFVIFLVEGMSLHKVSKESVGLSSKLRGMRFMRRKEVAPPLGTPLGLDGSMRREEVRDGLGLAEREGSTGGEGGRRMVVVVVRERNPGLQGLVSGVEDMGRLGRRRFGSVQERATVRVGDGSRDRGGDLGDGRVNEEGDSGRGKSRRPGRGHLELKGGQGRKVIERTQSGNHQKREEGQRWGGQARPSIVKHRESRRRQR